NTHKRRKLELAARAQSRRGPTRGVTHDYHIKQLCDQEQAIVEHAERAYEVMIAHWQPKKPVTTSSGWLWAVSAAVKNRRAAATSRRADTYTSITWPCWSTARYT